jgi:hypothetical protein
MERDLVMANSVKEEVGAKLRSIISYENQNKRIASMHNCMMRPGGFPGASESDEQGGDYGME